MAIRRQTVDLCTYMADSEANYRRILKLLPEAADEMVYHVGLPGGQSMQVLFRVEQRCRYTTMLSIEQSGAGPWLAATHFEVRLYHDARMAEVFACQRRGRVYPVHEYPNANMFQPDEKLQQHRFLTECLRHCLQNGFSEMADPVL